MRTKEEKIKRFKERIKYTLICCVALLIIIAIETYIIIANYSVSYSLPLILQIVIGLAIPLVLLGFGLGAIYINYFRLKRPQEKNFCVTEPKNKNKELFGEEDRC